MSFKISVSESYFAPVTVELPGSKTKNVFDAEFRRLSQDELTGLTAKIKEAGMDDKAVAREVVCGWSAKHVLDEDGNAVDYSTQALEEMLNIYPVAASIVTAFYASISGSRVKN